MLQYSSTTPFTLVDTDTGRTIRQFHTLGVFYDVHDGFCTMIKHGEYSLVLDIYNAYMKVNELCEECYNLFNFKLLKIEKCSLEDLNHIVLTSALPESYFLKLTDTIIQIEQ